MILTHLKLDSSNTITLQTTAWGTYSFSCQERCVFKTEKWYKH